MLVIHSWLQDNLTKIKNALFKTRRGVLQYAPTEEGKFIEVSNELFEDLYEDFIKADVGTDLSNRIISNLKQEITNQRMNKNDFQNKIKETIKEIVKPVEAGLKPASTTLNIYLIVGVNGTGKTTTIGKLANRFKNGGFKVLIVAADTFRAAAQDQLHIWAKRAEVEIYAPLEIKKPDAVVFSAIEKAKKENHNLLLIDTAGRLHSQANLMDELKKINSVIEKQTGTYTDIPLQYEKLIVLDATIGQNAITQADLFSKAIQLTGIILAKLDSSAKGGVVLNIMNKLNLPVKLIGTGEKIDDIAEFNLDEYAEGLI